MKPAAGVQVKADMRTRSEKTHVSLEAKDVALRWGISACSHGGVNPVRIVMKAFSAQWRRGDQGDQKRHTPVVESIISCLTVIRTVIIDFTTKSFDTLVHSMVYPIWIERPASLNMRKILLSYAIFFTSLHFVPVFVFGQDTQHEQGAPWTEMSAKQ